MMKAAVGQSILQCHIFECFQAWIKIGDIQSETLIKNPLFSACFDISFFNELYIFNYTSIK